MQEQQALSRVATEKADQLSAKKRKTELDVITRSNSDPTVSSSIASNPVLSMYAKVDKASADASVARFFYANGLPFNASRSKEYVEMLNQVSRMPAGYSAPSYNRLRNECLAAEKQRISDDLASTIAACLSLPMSQTMAWTWIVCCKYAKWWLTYFWALYSACFANTLKYSRTMYCVLRIAY